jgi:hypothetical protein
MTKALDVIVYLLHAVVQGDYLVGTVVAEALEDHDPLVILELSDASLPRVTLCVANKDSRTLEIGDPQVPLGMQRGRVDHATRSCLFALSLA